MSASLPFAGQDRLMVLAVHPDDETLGAGCLLQQAAAAGVAVRVVFVTDGDNNPWPQRILERRWHIGQNDRIRWGCRRKREALAALAVLGVNPQQAVFLGLPDQGISALLEHGDTRVVDQLHAEISSWQPSMLVTSSMQDLHPDHNALAVLLDLALARLTGATVRPQVLDYLIHRRRICYSVAWTLRLSARQYECKRRALLCHETQVALSRRRFMQHVKTQESFFAPSPDARFQPFHPVEEVFVEGNTLHVRIRIKRLLRLVESFSLILVAQHPRHRSQFRLPLDGRSGSVNVTDMANGSVVGRAEITRFNCMTRVAIPLHLVADAEALYLKLERRWGFFDVAGWRRAQLSTLAARPAVKTVGIVPCYNVEGFCEQVVRQAVNFVDHVIVIDDGSTDGTAGILARLVRMMPERISLIAFADNRGKGVGLMAGFCEALNRFDVEALVTLDADGQHPPAEIPSLVKAIAAGADMAIGERQIQQMPGRSKFGNSFISVALRWLYSRAPMDTQSGMRAFNPAFAEEIVRKVEGSRYETEFQVLLLALAQKRFIATAPIPTIYIDNNRSSKFRPVADSLRIMSALIRWRFDRCLNGSMKASR